MLVRTSHWTINNFLLFFEIELNNIWLWIFATRGKYFLSHYRDVHAHSCIMGNRGKMAGNSKICIGIQNLAPRVPWERGCGIQSQVILPEFIYLLLSAWKGYLTSSKKQYTKSGVQRRPWSVFRKPHFFNTFSVILILSNDRKCMGKSRFSKIWSRTSNIHPASRVASFCLSFLYRVSLCTDPLSHRKNRRREGRGVCTQATPSTPNERLCW